MPSLLRGDSCAPFPLREQWFGHLSQKKSRPLTQRAFEELIEFASKRVEILPVVAQILKTQLLLDEITNDRGFDLLLDGILGMREARIKDELAQWIRIINKSDQISVGFRLICLPVSPRLKVRPMNRSEQILLTTRAS